MEKRYETRNHVRMSVVIHGREGEVGTFAARNATRQGMFIETRDTRFLPNEVIWIDVSAQRAGRWPGAVPAVVVHQGADGIGVLLSKQLPGMSGAAGLM